MKTHAFFKAKITRAKLQFNPAITISLKNAKALKNTHQKSSKFLPFSVKSCNREKETLI